MPRNDTRETTFERMQRDAGWFDPSWNAPPFQHVAHFTGTWAADLDRIRQWMPSGHGNQGRRDGFTQLKSQETMQERVHFGASAELTYFDVSYDVPPALQRMAAMLGMEEYDVRLHWQQPYSLMPVHIDTYRSHPARVREDAADDDEMHEQLYAYERFIIALNDWEIGQLFSFGDALWANWRAGDVVFSQQRDVPHCTANCSPKPRLTMFVTGRMTDASWRIVTAGPHTFHVDAT